jgi:hypothetical protein
MTGLLLAWVAFPLALLALSLGCGRLVRRLAPAVHLPDPLLVPVGFAVLVVLGGFLTATDATAELAVPVAVVVAVGGLALGGPPRPDRELAWPALCAALVFAVCAAPIVLSGEATFAGYVALDDTATWMAFTDRIMEHGRSLEGLPPSTYEATLDLNLAEGYPVGAFMPLGIASALVGEDVAWTIQPYMAFLAALLALALYELAGSLVRSQPLRAIAAAIGAQAALLYGYYLWGGVKEVAAAALIATGAALVGTAIRGRFALPALVPLALVAAALVGVLSLGGSIWLLPPLLFAGALAYLRLDRRTALERAGAFVMLTAALAIPAIAAGLLPPTSSPLRDSDAIGNLAGPLEPVQLAGIWPAGDFRFDPNAELVTAVLIAVAIGGAALALGHAWRRREPAVPLYVAGSLLACGAIAVFASPWVDAKAFATAAPAIPFAAALAGALLWTNGRRAAGAALVGALAAGVLWSNALAYRDVSLAPRDQLAELEQIGERIAGQGPTLMTEYQPYGARHFLRDAAPEGVSELRRRPIPLAGGERVPMGQAADTDELSAPALLEYRTLVLRRSPVRSRPPSPYRLVSTGEHYEVWQRPAGPPPDIERLPLGSRLDPTGRAPCADVLELSESTRPSAGLLAAAGARPVSVPVDLVPSADEVVRRRLRIRTPGTYDLWLGGSLRPRVELEVDGVPAGWIRHRLNNAGQYVHLGTAELDAGSHEVAIRFGGADLHPGSGGNAREVGPLALSRSGARPRIERVPVASARRLCGRRLDWVEAP